MARDADGATVRVDEQAPSSFPISAGLAVEPAPQGHHGYEFETELLPPPADRR
jgi:hypothetical protein